MPYYPKSQVKTNLYTKGGELQLKSTKQEYIGFFWKNSKGEVYSKKNPNSFGVEPLELIPSFSPSTDITISYNKGNNVYNNLKNVDITQSFLIPSYTKPKPTPEEYELSNFVRNFAKKTNELLYIEISKDIFNKLQSKDNQYDYNSYLIFNLTWTLTGDKQKVSQTNKNIIALTEQNYNIIGLGEYLKFNYLEFYK